MAFLEGLTFGLMVGFASLTLGMSFQQDLGAIIFTAGLAVIWSAAWYMIRLGRLEKEREEWGND